MRILKILIVLTLFLGYTELRATEYPNILLIIADDMGADVMPGYDIGTNLPHTPHLDALRESGLTFSNVWATPVCAASRASLMTGKYGINNGVPSVPGILSTEHRSIFKLLKAQTDDAYTCCLIGKWHLGRVKDYDHPLEHGVDEFMGVMENGVSDYYKWNKVENGSADTCYAYATSYFTDYASEWINEQEQPWLMWLAHVSPHDPYHFPPEGSYSVGKEGSVPMKKYLSMIENLDYEVGRLLDSIPDEVLENTLIIFIGDNGTPGNLVQGYSSGKGGLYQGGIHVPMVVSGKGVSRRNELEAAHINICDLFATIAHFSNESLSDVGGLYNSLSFKHLLTGSEGYTRKYNYMELGANADFPRDAYTIRNDRYKMIQFVDSIQEFYDLLNDPYETNELLAGSLSSLEAEILEDLEQEATAIRTGWSCSDGIQNGDETAIDCGGSCGDCETSILSEIDIGSEARVFPNPFDAQICLEFDEYREDIDVRIFDVSGKIVDEISLAAGNSISIATQHYEPGMYFVSLLDSGKNNIYKLIKNRQ